MERYCCETLYRKFAAFRLLGRIHINIVMFGSIKMEALISPNYTQEKFNNPTFDDLPDVLKDRVLNWLLEPARILIIEKDGCFGALCLLFTRK